MLLNEGKRYVAFFDILGFKNWVQKAGSKNVFEYARSFLNLIIQVSLPGSLAKPDMTVDSPPSNIFYINFSDSIVYYTLDDSYESFRNILRVSAEFINVAICGLSRTIRGGLSFGEFYADTESNAYVGQALIDAYELEEQQEWLGVSIDQHIEDTQNFSMAQKEFSNLFVRSLTSLRDHNYKPFCLNWTECIAFTASFNVSKSLEICLQNGLNALQDKPVLAKKLRRRILNTREFIEHCKSM